MTTSSSDVPEDTRGGAANADLKRQKMTPREEAESRHFVFLTAEDRNTPGRTEQLRAEAERTGRMLVQAPQKSAYAEKIEAWASDKATGRVARGDDRGFLANLEAIAAGRKVVG